MKRPPFLSQVLFFLFLIPVTLAAQRDTLHTFFLDAESWFLFEEYAEALPLYMKLHQADPENANINYRIGICLLNDPYRKEQSIRYLLEASGHIDPEYKENSFKERAAPPDVLYYLGNAYLVNRKLEEAVDTYERFLEIMDPEVYDRQLVEAQIRACRNARQLMKVPVDIDLHLLSSLINTRYPDVRPVVSGDGTKMAFVTELPFYDGAFYTERVDGEWTYPRNITPELGFDTDVYPACLSHDGTEMILYYDEDYIGNLYYSRFEEGRWLPAEKMGEPINTRYWESHACFSADGKTLYFTSNRKGTIGGLDIYRSERQADGTWGIPENLGPTINTRYNEMSPFITEDGQTLYFSSYGHFSMGGYDIFYSRRNKDGSWGTPVNLGYPLNTTDDDLFYDPVKNGRGAYYSIYDQKRGIGRHDIYYVDVYSPENPRMYPVAGSIATGGGMPDPTRTTICVVNPATGDTLLTRTPEEGTGDFSFSLPQGIYRIHISAPGYDPLVRPLDITAYTDKEGVRLEGDIELQPEVKEPLVFEGEQSWIQLRDSVYEGLAGETGEASGAQAAGAGIAAGRVTGEEAATERPAGEETVQGREAGPEARERQEGETGPATEGADTAAVSSPEKAAEAGRRTAGDSQSLKAWPFFLGLLAGGALMLLVILWWKRRKKKNENAT
jgi:tetratricopeptide (TPR) repeat protein